MTTATPSARPFRFRRLGSNAALGFGNQGRLVNADEPLSRAPWEERAPAHARISWVKSRRGLIHCSRGRNWAATSGVFSRVGASLLPGRRARRGGLDWRRGLCRFRSLGERIRFDNAASAIARFPPTRGPRGSCRTTGWRDRSESRAVDPGLAGRPASARPGFEPETCCTPRR